MLLIEHNDNQTTKIKKYNDRGYNRDRYIF